MGSFSQLGGSEESDFGRVGGGGVAISFSPTQSLSMLGSNGGAVEKKAECDVNK